MHGAMAKNRVTRPIEFPSYLAAAVRSTKYIDVL